MSKHFQSNDGRLLQANKKWRDLSLRQREWIGQITREEQAAFVKETGKLPMGKKKQPVIDRVMERIRQRGIWIPDSEAKLNISKYIDRANHHLERGQDNKHPV